MPCRQQCAATATPGLTRIQVSSSSSSLFPPSEPWWRRDLGVAEEEVVVKGKLKAYKKKGYSGSTREVILPSLSLASSIRQGWRWRWDGTLQRASMGWDPVSSCACRPITAVCRANMIKLPQSTEGGWGLVSGWVGEGDSGEKPGPKNIYIKYT